MAATLGQGAVLVAVSLASVTLAYTGPGFCDLPSLFALLALLAVTLLFAWRVFESAVPGPLATYAALFAVALCGLNPACIEPLANFAHRPALLSTLGVAGGLVLYQWRPEWRKYGIYLLPVLGAAFFHRTALVFGPLLFLYAFLLERNAAWRSIPAALLGAIPGALASLPALWFAKTGPPVPAAPFPQAVARMLAAFLFPFGPVGHTGSIGVAILAGLLGAAVYAASKCEMRPAAFGLVWFLLLRAVAPADAVPAIIGLALAVSCLLVSLAVRLRGAGLQGLTAACVGVLIVSGAVSVWSKAGLVDARLWQSRNPEHWLRLSLHYYQTGHYPESIDVATTALTLKPDYAEAYNNIGASFASMKMWDQAIAGTQAALRLKPDLAHAKDNLLWAQQQKQHEDQ
jgi:hypothetical protein